MKLPNYSPIQAIAEDRVLRFYGVFVSLLLTLTTLNIFDRRKWQWLVPNSDPICWPMFDNCRDWRVFTPEQVKTGLIVFGVASLLTACAFLRPRWVRVGWYSLLLLTVVKTAILLMDYQMRLNQHIMATWIAAAFLFLPDKKRTIKLLILMFYFWPGIIKLTPEWLSGAALYTKPWPIDGFLLPYATAYVVILEIVLAWGLLWERSKLAWFTLAQLIVFHLMSYQVVGFFYPALMLAILAIFPLSWWLEPQSPRLIDDLRAPRTMLTPLGTVLLFSALQVWPQTFPGDTAITGEGRLVSLHMFDAYTSCEAQARMHHRGAPDTLQNLYRPMAVRIHCDPVVYLSRARNLCYRNQMNPRFVDLDLTLRTKRSTDTELQTVLDIPNFCGQNIEYSLRHHNVWIQTQD